MGRRKGRRGRAERSADQDGSRSRSGDGGGGGKGKGKGRRARGPGKGGADGAGGGASGQRKAVPFGVTRTAATRKEAGVAGEEFYADSNALLSEDHLREALRMRFDPDAWRAAAEATAGSGPQYGRALRKMVQIGTLGTLLRGWYTLPDGDVVHLARKRLDKAARGTVCVDYEAEAAADPASLRGSLLAEVDEWFGRDVKPGEVPLQTQVCLIQGDVLETALALQRAVGASARNVCVLVNGSYNMPGGGWKKGAAALEENLHRRTSIVEALEDPYSVVSGAQWRYPLPQVGGLAIPAACVFRGSEPSGYPFLERPAFVSMVVGWAFKAPPIEGTGPSARLGKKERRLTLAKIASWLDMAVEVSGNSPRPRIFVASPIGCGVYANPPHDIARLFSAALALPRFAGVFDIVAFSILDPTGPETYDAFADALAPILTLRADSGLTPALLDLVKPPADAGPSTTMLAMVCVALCAAAVAQGNTSPSTFQQKTDHFDNSNTATFSQRYTVNATHYRKGGPIFFFLSGEAPMEAFEFQEVQAQLWAAQRGGMFVVLEHRFYGQSMPAPDFATPGLSLLSSEQALADAAAFAVWFNADLEARGMAPGPWVVVGCSYSAGLAAWFRTRHPYLVVGAVCPSGPVQATLDQSDFLAWFEHAAPAPCVAAAKAGSAAIEAELARGQPGLAALSTAFNTCEPLTDDDVFWFLWNVALAVGTADQFSNSVPENTLTEACDILAAESDPIAAFAKIVATSENIYTARPGGNSCVHLSQSYFIADMARPDNPNRSWWWQKCTEFGYFKTSVNGSSIFFPSYSLGLDRIVPLCEAIYGIDGLAPQIEWTNANYGGKNLVADNVVFTNGLLDPWHLLSISSDLPAPSKVKAVTYEAGHCATLNAASPDDPPSLLAARKFVEAQLDAWLATH
ncbi:uncharacterized protein AMSG_12158 [Thecamonas trahens ATCC 50062]|uniref:Microbial-type PARG catalytic domain-containing protein n=1 Tax=Thecamonas trahens ATCC 50062 TaxID=461836 RepID=A0A0L0DJJ5_THETB|nr:hypothetical protein AMSG_12158 [Thecamonas trahens ATCC 50062]KNC52380.1 hypothetical protein AMSG_12158 [Thecamonas trahens ATCC 50062]|eukprot:XP_013755498.1 hypothetical protein AMSG_12158 [Thecamonas trahens ATCC 50062]